MRISALVRLAATLATATVVGTLAATAPATAAEPAPPVVVNDTISLYPGQASTIDVLTNDSAPSGDSLALCRFPEVDLDATPLPSVIAIEVPSILGGKPGQVAVSVSPGAHGTATIDYYVCDFTHLAPARLTVQVRAVAPVDVAKVPGHPGRLRVTNHNDRAVGFWYGDPRASRPDHGVRIPAHRSRVVRVQRHRIDWIATIGPGGKHSLLSSPGIADHGVVRGIKLHGAPLPLPKGSGPGFDDRALQRWSQLRG